MDVYVYHRGNANVTGSAFRIGSGGGFTGEFVSVTFGAGFLVQGNIEEGVAVAYDGCVNGWSLHVATITYAVFGTSQSCSYLEILPYTEGGAIETYGCDFVMEPATGNTRLIVNHEPSCGPLWCVLSTEATTWGKVKALYR
jgi:hypothetical protein